MKTHQENEPETWLETIGACVAVALLFWLLLG